MKLTKIILSLLVCFSLTACQTTSNTVETPSQTDSTAEVSQSSQEFTIVDHAGREVSFDQPCETVASGYYITTTSLIGLGLADNIVGVEMKADSRPIYSLSAEHILSLPALGNKKEFNVEECAKADPDVVFLPIGLESYVQQLEDLDIKVVLLQPETKESFDDALNIIGKVMGVEDKVNDYFNYRSDLLSVINEPEEMKRVYFAGSDILEAAGADMYQSAMIKDAKGINVMEEPLAGAASWQTINVEELIKADPEYIFMEQGGLSVEDVLNNSALADVSAVKNGNVYIFPSEIETWDTPNLSSCLGVLWMYATLYPESLSIDDVAQLANSFYQEYYGFEANLSF